MNLGVFLAIGESFQDFKQKGQDKLIKNFLLQNYSRNFDKVFVFSYGNDQFTIFNNVFILPNKWKVNRFLYSVLLPVFYSKEIASCSILRGLQLTGGLPCMLSKLIFGKKFVINYGYFYQEFAKIESKNIQSFLYRIIEKPILKLSDAVIVTASYLDSYLQTQVSAQKIKLLPNGVDVDIFKKQEAKKKKEVLYVGRLERQKNLKNLVKAMSFLKKEKLKLIIIGSGVQKRDLQSLAKKKRVNLVIVDRVTHNKLPDTFNRALLFVLPSIIEGQPKALLEAMSCSLPIVASDIQAHREIIRHGENGILCGTSAKEITKGIKLILENKKLREKISHNARKTILKSFSMKKLNKQEINLLTKIAYNDKV